MVSREQLKAANERGKQLLGAYPRAVSAKYEARLGKVIIQLSNGHGMLLDPKRTQGLERATENQLDTIEILGPGLGLRFPKIDADLYVPGLLEGCFGSKKWAAAQLGRAGGGVKTGKKSAAARENGKLGGRPRKVREGAG